MWSNLVNSLVNWRLIFSQWSATSGSCELCFEQADSSGFLCSACRAALPYARFACSHCAEPVSTPGRCGRCQTKPPAFDYSFCSYLYTPPLSLWLRAAKDKDKQQWLRRLSWLQQQRQPPALAAVDALVVMPSSRLKRLRRGYDPAAILAVNLSKATGLPLRTNYLNKRHTQDQRGLNAKARRKNLRKAIRGNNLNLSGQHLLIIDDVMTTGASADAAARALKAQGAEIVGIWALARTPPISRSE